MQLHEVIQLTGLTKKAIGYDIEQGLLTPAVSENGYRNFSAEDVARLRQISVLRRLGLSTIEIREVLTRGTAASLPRISVQKELQLQKEQKKRTLLEQLGRDGDYDAAYAALAVLEQNSSILERLSSAFPGYLGCYICLHFAAFLNDPVTTAEQETAYRDIVSFLDGMPDPDFPPEVCDFLEEMSGQLSPANIASITDSLRQCAAAPGEYISRYREAIDGYLSLRQTEDYQQSPVAELQSVVKSFYQTSGYYDIFLPAMERLSPSYADYRRQLADACRMLSAQYPELKD